MRITDDRYHRDLRRFQLALRLIRHEARTHTICKWTGLTDDRVRNFCRTYGVSEAGHTPVRHRGPMPQRLDLFFRSPVLRSEAAAVGGLCRLLGVIPDQRQPNARRELPSVSRGEQLCRAYELYRACVPDTPLTLEQVMLLATVLAQGEQLELAHCTECHAAIVIDLLGRTRHSCAHCTHDANRAKDSH